MWAMRWKSFSCFVCRKEGQKRLQSTKNIAYWGVPVLVTIFLAVYWSLGIANYWHPDLTTRVDDREQEDGTSILWIVLGVTVAVVPLLLLLASCLLPRCLARCSSSVGQAVNIVGNN